MLTETYTEALLVDEELADQVWELWDSGPISDELAAGCGGLSAAERCSPSARLDRKTENLSEFHTYVSPGTFIVSAYPQV